MGAWEPMSEPELLAIIQEDLKACSPRLRHLWEQYRVSPRRVGIDRSGSREQVWIVAQRGTQVLYWEDVEEGFNIAELDRNGDISDPGFEQDDLAIALTKWQQRSK